MITETWDEGMPIMQVKVHMLAESAKRAYDVEHVRQGASHRVLDVRHQVGQTVVHRAELLEVQARMALSEQGGYLSQANVTDVDAATDSLSFFQPLRNFDEPPAIQSGGVLEKEEGAVPPFAKAGI